MDTAIQKAQERMTFVTNDKESLRAYQMREMALFDLTSGLDFARREGRQEGIAIGEERGEKRGITIGEKKGKIEGKIEIVINMKKAGMDIHQIMELTNLSEDKIKRL